jgi:hypothetical protein
VEREVFNGWKNLTYAWNGNPANDPWMDEPKYSFSNPGRDPCSRVRDVHRLVILLSALSVDDWIV